MAWEPLDPAQYTVAWIAPLAIEAQAALNVLDNKHSGRFPLNRGDDYVFRGGDINGHNVVIATLPAGQEYGTGSAAALASQLKKFFPNLWFGLLVGVAAGLPNLAKQRDIRLGDVLVGLPIGDNAGIVAYDLGKETSDGFQLLQYGRALDHTIPVVRSAIGDFMIDSEDNEAYFLSIYESLKLKKHSHGDFSDPGEELDVLYDTVGPDGSEVRVDRKKREKRTHVWYGTIGSGDKLVKNASIRNRLRDTYDIIGLEMEAAGTMNRIPVGVIRGVCDYGDEHKNKVWQPYAAAMAAAYAKALFRNIPAKDAVGEKTAPVTRTTQGPMLCDLPPKAVHFFGRTRELSEMREVLMASGDDCKWLVLCGISGSGKTQLARNFVDQEAKSFSAILWIDATSVDSAKQSLDACARSIRKMFQEFRPSDDSSARHVVMEWLRVTPKSQWLLLLDGMDQPTPHQDFLYLLKQLRRGAICITSTHFGLAGVMRVKQKLVEQLDPLSANAMVLWHAFPHEEQPVKDSAYQQAAGKVSKALHCFPLAIELSGILIQRGIVSISEFPTKFETDYCRLAKTNLSGELRMWSKAESLFGLFETIYTSLIDNGNAEAGLLLSLCAVYGTSRIPMSLLARLELFKSGESPWKQLQDMLRDETAFNIAISRLSQMFLVKKAHAFDGSVASLYLHSSVSQWRFNDLENRPDWIIQASYGLARHVQAGEERHCGEPSGSAIRYVQLANRCLSAIEMGVSAGDLEAPDGKFAFQYFTIASSFAFMYHSLSEFQLARRLFAAAIAYTRTQDDDSLDQKQLVTLFHAFGTACARDGSWENAEDTLKTALAMAESVYGHMSEEAARITSQLNSVRRSQGDDLDHRRRAIAGLTGPKRNESPENETPPPSYSLAQSQFNPPHATSTVVPGPSISLPAPSVMKGNNQADLLVGISIGIRDTAIAYIIAARSNNETRVFKNWNGKGLDDRIPTRLQYLDNNAVNIAKPVAWGYGCNTYTAGASSKIVWNFRDAIQRRSPGLTDYQQVMAERYIQDYLELLYERLREHFSSTDLNRKKWRRAAVKFYFSVPVYWSKETIVLFEHLVGMAGFGRPRHHRVAISTEPSALVDLTSSSDYFKAQNDKRIIVITSHDCSVHFSLLLIESTAKNHVSVIAVKEKTEVGPRSLLEGLFSSRLMRPELQKRLKHPVDETARSMARIFESQSLKDAFEATDLDDNKIFKTKLVGMLEMVHEPSLRVSCGEMEISWGEIREFLDKQMKAIKDSLIEMTQDYSDSPMLCVTIDHIVLAGGLGSSLYVQKNV